MVQVAEFNEVCIFCHVSPSDYDEPIYRTFRKIYFIKSRVNIWPIWVKINFARRISMQITNIKFHSNSSINFSPGNETSGQT